MRTRRWIVFVIMAMAMWLVSCIPAPLTEVPPDMVGDWQGEAKIIVAWVEQEMLPVALTIHEDGTVEGHVGDATLVSGSIRSNSVGSEYIIVADLDGAIVSTEDVHRDGVKIPMDFDGERFAGGVASTGTKAGGKETMILTASDLVLHRATPT